ncbi:MAG: OB-fold domain-containing protein, partial [Candidatus Amoebophilus sp.]
MIAFLKGTVKEISSHLIIVFVNNMGYTIWVANENIYSIDQVVELYTYFHWNQENGPQLYGFSS